MFEQFGFVKERDDGTHAVGTCPFCKKQGHFYINVTKDNHPWDCKRCGRSGGFQKFLQAAVEFASEDKAKIRELAERRGLAFETLDLMRIGWMNDFWLVPIFSRDGKTVLNVKLYDVESFKNTAGCHAAFYGLQELPADYDAVYLAEGEWDALAMMEMIADERAAVLGVPGVGASYPPEILELLAGKSVYLLYDNDLAGRNGSKKAITAAQPVAAELRSLRWPETTAEKWDVRDVYVKDFQRNGAKALEWIRQHSILTTPTEKNVQTPEMNAPHVPHTLVYETFNKWFHLSDNPRFDQKATDIYDVVFGTVFANRIPGDPVWLYLIAPPGGFKTEPLLALAGGKLIEIHESVTAPALISGQNFNGGTDPSLVPTLNGRLLIIKDFTIILGLPEAERKEILSILRGAFDGQCGRTFGNGVRRQFKSTFGVIAATTPVIEQYTEETAAIGERFLSWRNWISEDYSTRCEHIRRALKNTACEQEMRREINGISKRVLLSGYDNLPVCSEKYTDQVVKLSQWIAVMRGAVARDRYRKNVLYKPFSEVATRLSKEIYKLLLGISIFKGQGSVRPDTMRIARSVAWSSVSSRYAETFRAFLEKPVMTSVDAERAVQLPPETMEILMENMMLLGILENPEGVRWSVRPKFMDLSKEAGLV